MIRRGSQDRALQYPPYQIDSMAQLVERRSPKPQLGGSMPSRVAIHQRKRARAGLLALPRKQMGRKAAEVRILSLPPVSLAHQPDSQCKACPVGRRISQQFARSSVDRVSVSEAEGRAFDPRRANQTNLAVAQMDESATLRTSRPGVRISPARPDMETWPSGRRRLPAKEEARDNRVRGFKSHRFLQLRQRKTVPALPRETTRP